MLQWLRLGLGYNGSQIDSGSVQCDNPDEFVFWDDVHPTSAVHEVLAGQLLAVIDVPQPLFLLALGLAAALVQKRRAAKPR